MFPHHAIKGKRKGNMDGENSLYSDVCQCREKTFMRLLHVTLDKEYRDHLAILP